MRPIWKIGAAPQVMAAPPRVPASPPARHAGPKSGACGALLFYTGRGRDCFGRRRLSLAARIPIRLRLQIHSGRGGYSDAAGQIPNRYLFRISRTIERLPALPLLGVAEFRNSVEIVMIPALPAPGVRLFVILPGMFREALCEPDRKARLARRAPCSCRDKSHHPLFITQPLSTY